MDTTLDGAVLSRVVRGEAERAPDRVVVVVENDQLPAVAVTAADLAAQGNRLAAALAGAGLSRGVPVALMAGNCPEALYALVANSQLGLPTVPVDPRAQPDTLTAVLGLTDCAAIVVEERLLADQAVATAIARSGAQPFVIGAPGRSEGPSLGPLLGEILAGPEAADAGEHVDDLADPWLLCVGAGASKDSRALQVEHGRQLFLSAVAAHLGYRPDDVVYTGLNATHAHALMDTVMPALRGQIDHAVLSRRFSHARLWDVCIEHRVTAWSSFGELASAVYNEPSSHRDRQHRVRLVVSVGMPREIWRAFEQRFGVRVLEWYGTLEGGFACNPAGVGPVGSFGKPPADLVMDVVGEDGSPVPAGSIGELILRPAGGEARVAYYRDPEGSARAVRDGWLHTGDLVTRDANGWLYFVQHMAGADRGGAGVEPIASGR
ncbi:MAG TPA: AMP-binding protein [Sporichthya sp.]|nr:AMP-binding protein [Sporichthya sp.]